MFIYFYSFIPLLFLPTYSSSIRDRNFKNELVPLLSSRLDAFKKDTNSLKIVSNEPFIIQLQMPDSRDNMRRGSKEKDTKKKRPAKKRISKIKPLRKKLRHRRDLQTPIAEADKETNLNLPQIPQSGKTTEQSKNTTKNSINRVEILKALSSYSKKREAKKNKDDEESNIKIRKRDFNITEDSNLRRLSFSKQAPHVKMVYPSTPKTNKHPRKYTHKDLIADRERLEKKIQYIRNMLNASTTEDVIRVRRRSESDRTANKIAKMFLTLSAVNGLHERLKPKCDTEGEEDYFMQDIWEKERKDKLSRKSSSSNEERYKVKKWIEHMKKKRSSGKTCPCVAKEYDEESDAFPLEQKLPKSFHLLPKEASSEESSEAFRDTSQNYRDQPIRNNLYKKRNYKTSDDYENKLKALARRTSKKLELPLDDLELYRSKAKQILQNAEEILDKIKEDEERKLSAPNILMSQLKELTSKIQADPRNNENDLIRKIQKNLGWGLRSTSQDVEPLTTDENTFLENVKSFILDPYEKAKALTDESTKKLSSYLLRNLGELQEPGEIREDDDDDNKKKLKTYFGQEPQKECEKCNPASLIEKNADSKLSNCKENLQNGTDIISFIPNFGDENKNTENPSNKQEEQFQKRIQEIIKEQEKKVNECEVEQEYEDKNAEPVYNVGNGKKQQTEDRNTEQKLCETLRSSLSADLEGKEPQKMHKNTEVAENKASKELQLVSENKIPEGKDENEHKVSINFVEQGVEVLKDLNEKQNIRSKEVPEVKELKSDDEISQEPSRENSSDQEKLQEVVNATPKKLKTDQRDDNVDLKDRFDYNILSTLSYLTEETDETFDSLTEKSDANKAEDILQDKSIEETLQEKQSDTEKNSATNNSKEKSLYHLQSNEETITLSDARSGDAVNNRDEIREKTEQRDSANEEMTLSEKAMEFADLIQEPKLGESLEKTKPNEDENEAKSEEKGDLEDNEYSQTTENQAKNEVASENIQDDDVAKAAVADEEENLTDSDYVEATLYEKNSKEGSEENKKEILDNRNKQNFTFESSVVSAKPNDHKGESFEEFSDETLLRQTESIESSNEASREIKAFITDTSNTNADEDGKFLKEGNSDDEGNSSKEASTLLKATIINQTDGKDLDVNFDDKTAAMAAHSEKNAGEKTKNLGDTNETLLESVTSKIPKSEEDVDDSSQSSSGLDQERNKDYKDEETRGVSEEGDDKTFLKSTKLIAHDGEKENLEILKKKNDGEISEHTKNNLDEREEMRVKAINFISNHGNENSKSDNDNDTVIQQENSDEELESEENKDTLLKALESHNMKNLKKQSEENFSEKTNSGRIDNYDEKMMNWGTTDETLKSDLENHDQENYKVNDVDDETSDETSLQVTKFNEELEMMEESLKKDEKTNETGEAFDNEETPSKKVNNEDISSNFYTNAEDETSSQRAKFNEELEMTNESLKNDKTEEMVADYDDKKTPLKAVNNKELNGQPYANDEYDDEASTQTTDNKNPEAIESDESEETLKAVTEVSKKVKADENIYDDTPLTPTLNNDEVSEILNRSDGALNTYETSFTEANEDDNMPSEEPTDSSANLKATLYNDDQTPEEDSDEIPEREANFKDKNNLEKKQNSNESVPSLRATLSTEEPVNVVKTTKETNGDGDEQNQKTDESAQNLKAIISNENQATLKDNDQTSQKASSIDVNDNAANLNEETDNETLEMRGDGGTSLRAESFKNEHEKKVPLVIDGNEASLQVSSLEELNNDIDDDDDDDNDEETPLKSSIVGKNDAEEEFYNSDSEETFTTLNTFQDFSKQINEENEDKTLKSVNPFYQLEKESEKNYETSNANNPLDNSEETEIQTLSTEKEFPLSVENPVQRLNSKEEPRDDISFYNLQKPREKPFKTSNLKVPTSIAKIVKDLEGKEKDDLTSLENLNPAKIDHIIDKIDEAEQQNKVIDAVDCRKECACAEDINTRSRNIGRYEIVKDFLHWMKDLQLNRVLGDE